MSSKDSPGIDEKLVRRILSYCLKHPDAKDTPDGILKWWLSEGREEDVQRALDFLFSTGWLTKRHTAPSKEIYGINKDRLEDIKRFLEGS